MGFKALFGRKKKFNSSIINGIGSTSSITLGSGSATPMMLGSRSGSVNTSAEIARQLEEVFKKFDVNGDGKISAEELGSIMASLGEPATEEELVQMMIEVDSDGDGFIDLNKFIELNTLEIDSAEALKSLNEAFSLYDLDKNGKISAEELHRVMQSLSEECSVSDCRKMISAVDRNGDGMISFDEFKVMMMATKTLHDKEG